MGRGLKTKGGRIMQWIRHGANPNLFEPNGLRVVCSNFEEYDYAEAIDFDKIKRQGAKALHANVPLEGIWTGTAKGALGYNLVDDQILAYLVAKPMRSDVTTGVRETEYRRPQFDRADREFFAVQEGIPTDCELGCFGLLTGFKWSSKRGNKGVSRFDLSFVTQTAVPFGTMTGGAPANAKYALGGANVAGNVVLAVSVNGGATQNVTLAPGDNAAGIKIKIQAAVAGSTVNVMGTGISSGTGFTVSGAGDASYNGDYAQDGTFVDPGTGVANPKYKNAAGRFLIYDQGAFRFTSAAESSNTLPQAYQRAAATFATGPVGAYGANAGTAPGPTVVAATSGATADAQIEFTVPTNTPVAVTKVSGTNYTIAQTQQGSNGDIISAIVEPLPVLPSHILLYRADTLAGLDLPAALVGKVQDWEYNDSKICQPQSHHVLVADPARPNLPATYDSYFEEETEEDSIVLTATLDCDDSQDVPTLVAMARATGGRYVSKAGYWRIVATCPIAPYLIKCEFYGSIGSSIPRKFGGNVEQRTLAFDLIENREQPWALRWITRRPV